MFTRTTTLFVALLILATKTFSQENKPVSQANKSIYVELGANGGFLSLNYDARFAKRENGWGYRVGIGFVPGFDGFFTETSTMLAIPVGINHLTGRKSSHFESGLGVTYISGNVSFFGDEKERARGVAFIPSAGYRYAKKGGGFVGRAVISPLVGGGYVQFYFGLAVGVHFK
jgi:hypothetical protein